MLQARVFTLSIFSDDGEINVGMTSGESRKRLAQNNGGVYIELLAHGYVPGYVTGLGNGSEKDSYQASE
jgi:hypothetical protein